MSDLSMPETLIAAAATRSPDSSVARPTGSSAAPTRLIQHFTPALDSDERQRRLAACYSLLLDLARQHKNDPGDNGREPHL